MDPAAEANILNSPPTDVVRLTQMQPGLNPNASPETRVLARLRPWEDPIQRKEWERLMGRAWTPQEMALQTLGGPDLPPASKPAPVVEELFEPQPAEPELQLDVASLTRRLRGTPVPLVCRKVVSVFPMAYPYERWSEPMRMEVEAGMHQRLLCDEWIESQKPILSGMCPRWDSGRAARLMAIMALMQSLADYADKNSLHDQLPDPVEQIEEESGGTAVVAPKSGGKKKGKK